MEGDPEWSQVKTTKDPTRGCAKTVTGKEGRKYDAGRMDVM
jgi:hypothetical protein